jgi:hypothetical protein
VAPDKPLVASREQRKDDAQQRKEIRSSDVDTLAGFMLSIVDGMSYIHSHQPSAPPTAQMIDTILSILLEGLYPRNEPLAGRCMSQ